MIGKIISHHNDVHVLCRNNLFLMHNLLDYDEDVNLPYGLADYLRIHARGPPYKEVIVEGHFYS